MPAANALAQAGGAGAVAAGHSTSQRWLSDEWEQFGKRNTRAVTPS